MTKPELFYEKLASLFYAIANADGRVKRQELQMLHQEINTIWKEKDDPVDEFNTDLVFEVEAVFEWLEDNRYDSKDAFNDFKDFALSHKTLFDKDTQQKILHTSMAIAHVFKSINHDEENLLHQLEDLLNSIAH